MPSHQYIALDGGPRRRVVAVDLGYSENARSCGVAWSGCEDPCHKRFGAAMPYVAAILNQHPNAVLVLEAALSTFHNPAGNPCLRGEFERGRGWYWGPGASSTLAAQRFLSELAELLRQPVLLAEAFLSNKKQRTRHGDDADTIVRRFWDVRPETLTPGVAPLLSIVKGSPSVRVFA